MDKLLAPFGLTMGLLFALPMLDDEDRPPSALQPGLIVTWSSPGSPPVEITGKAAKLALALQPGEAPHPWLDPEAFAIRWRGRLRILREGEYTFAVAVRGQFTLKMAGAEVISPGKPRAIVSLKPGDHLLEAEFRKQPGPAWLRLYWKSRAIYPEPVPHDAFGHLPEDVPDRLENDQLVEQGRFLVEELACAACHHPRSSDVGISGLQSRVGPDLSRSGERMHLKWIAAWLRHPQILQPRAVMPALFPEGPVGDAEIYAVAAYLASLAGPLLKDADKAQPNEVRASQARGEKLFHATGCSICHGPESPVYPLGRTLAEKTSLSALTRFLLDPLAINPSGRMPAMNLNPREAQDLARFLLRDTDPLPDIVPPPRRLATDLYDLLEADAAPRERFRSLDEHAAWRTLGQQLVVARRCTACHRLEPEGGGLTKLEAQSDFSAIRQAAAASRGCLSEGPPAAGVPRFSLTPEEKRAIVAFLTARPIRSSPAPAHAAEVALKRFQCLACHERNGQGGLTSAITEMLRRYEGVENAEAVTPPPLTGIGDKLTTSWIRAVLLEGARSRPWMALRMPRFGPGNIGHLPAGLLACDGITDTHDMTPELSDFEPLPREEDIQAGRLLVGKKAFGCIGCHDIAGVPSSGTRGPDLAAMTQRVRYPWYRRWLVQPQRIQPGTRMPTVFNEGRTLLDDVLGGDASRQADAIWSYLAIGPTLPLPDGLEPPPGLVLSVRDRPVLLRTFLPDVGPRSIAVGYPQHVNVAYDAAQCRPAYAWSGNFLDASPVWNDRGGNPARILGTRFWQAPAGFPWFFTRGDHLPDVLGRPRDPAYGASTQEGVVYAGPRLLRFAGIRFDPATSNPTFTSEATLGENRSCRIEERLEPLRDSYGVGIRRTFRLSLSSDHSAWLLLSEAPIPRFLSDRGQAVPVRTGDDRHPAKAGAILVEESSGKANVTVLDRVPEGSELRLLPTRDGKAVLLFLPTPADQVVQVSHWQPYRPVAPPP